MNTKRISWLRSAGLLTFGVFLTTPAHSSSMSFDGSLVRDTLIAPAGAASVASFDPIEPPPFYTSGPADVPSCIQAAFAPLAGWIPGVTSAVDVATAEC